MKPWDEYNWDFWHRDNDPLPEEAKEKRKISICTTCMDRTYDLRKTLEKNIIDNLHYGYKNLEFVVLNYNSKDDLDDFMKNEMIGFIKMGVLVYYKTTEPEFYEMGHSRNVAFKAASGDIVNNVDADNFTGKGFADAINKLAELQPEHAIFAKGKRMMHGRIGLYKKDFLEIGGYDEDLHGYGYDDHSVVIRAMNHFKGKFMWWTGVYGSSFMQRIKTSRNIVGNNMENKRWRETEKINKDITWKKIKNKEYIVNKNRHWGKAHLIKNFEEEINV